MPLGKIREHQTPFAPNFSPSITIMSHPTVGSPAPDFTLPVTGGEYADGAMVSSQSLLGQAYVLYFYPKDDTPGCTTQACALRDAWKSLPGNPLVFGVSTDSIRSHQKFIQKHQLSFPLLADEDKTLVEAYGVWVEKSMYGKTYFGTQRSTFVIGPDGRISAVLLKVAPGGHLEALQAVLMTA